MIYKYLIRHKGETLLVDNLDGYKGCKILEKDVAMPRSQHCVRVKGRWKINKTKHRKDARLAQLRCMNRLELVEMFEKQLQALEKRLQKLEGLPQGKQVVRD